MANRLDLWSVSLLVVLGTTLTVGLIMTMVVVLMR